MGTKGVYSYRFTPYFNVESVRQAVRLGKTCQESLMVMTMPSKKSYVHA